MIEKAGGVGIALENNCAIEFIDGMFYKVIVSNSRARAYRLRKSGRRVLAEQIAQRGGLEPSESLYS